MKRSGTSTKYPGIINLGPKKFRVRAKIRDPRTGKPKEVDRIVENVTLLQAVRLRAELVEEIGREAGPLDRVRVGEYAQSWMRSKRHKLEPHTARKYADALDKHILPALGDLYYDALTRRDVQEWVDRCLSGKWRRGTVVRPYTVGTARAWYRVFRNMTRDAVLELELDRDPSVGITFPAAAVAPDAKALTPEELARFLAAVRERYPQHFAMTMVLMFTGLRFCHVSALRWEDWDEEVGVIRVRRKRVEGRTGNISRKKPGPGVCPVGPELADVLRVHRRELLRRQSPGLADGWMFPGRGGAVASRTSIANAWRTCLKAAGVERRITIHGARYTFTDLTRLAGMDAVVRRALVGHVTEAMQVHYSNVGVEERHAAVAGVYRLVPLAGVMSSEGGDRGGDEHAVGGGKSVGDEG